MRKVYIYLVLFFLFQTHLQAQTVGLLHSETGAYDGYTMINKLGNTYLLDEGGQVVHTWATGNLKTHPGYLKDNGDLVTLFRSTDPVVFQGLKTFNWDGDLIWEYENPGAHHDMAILPNDNILVMIRGAKTNAETIAAGRDPAMLDDDLVPMVLYELDAAGAVVWEWHVWDHLIQDFDSNLPNYGVVADHPELVDINFTRNASDDWLHGNAIDYHPGLDQIMVSPRFNSEIWIIDHSTTTQEAAGHTGGQAGKGGDLLYRWGNPIAYGAGDIGDQQTFGSHNAQWIEEGLDGAGNILLFNNGGVAFGSDGDYSTIDEFIPPLNGFNYDLTPGSAYLPTMPTWMYIADPPESFFSSYIAGAQRLPNGNTFIDEGAYGFLFEITPTGESVWQYQNPIEDSGILFQGDPPPLVRNGSLFRSYKYAKDHPAFVGRDLTPQGPIEQYTTTYNMAITSTLLDSVAYPGIGTFTMGESQMAPLKALPMPGSQFVNWTLINGNAVITDPNSMHTTVLMGNSNTEIQANYVIDLIFDHGFE